MCLPTFYKASPQVERPPCLLSLHHCPHDCFLTISLFPHLCPHLPASPGPQALSPCPLPLCLSSATASSPACLGRGPAALPGHPPWLPLCGSELAPPPAPPRARPLILLWTQRSAPGTRPLGPRTGRSTSAPTEARVGPNRRAPGRGHGGGLPHQVYVSLHRAPGPGSWLGEPSPPPPSLLGGLPRHLQPVLTVPHSVTRSSPRAISPAQLHSPQL